MPYVSTKIKKKYDKQKKTLTEAVQNTSAVEIANNRRSDIKWLSDLRMIQNAIWKGQFQTTRKVKLNQE